MDGNDVLLPFEWRWRPLVPIEDSGRFSISVNSTQARSIALFAIDAPGEGALIVLVKRQASAIFFFRTRRR